jgi:teichuronic acid exporter
MSIINNIIISIGSKFLEFFILITSAIFLARLIPPSDFGTFAIIYATYALFSGFLDVGLSQSYIKAKEESQDLKNSFFTINIVLGLITTFLLVISAPIISYIYEDSILFELMLVFSSSVLISSLSLQPFSELNRRKEFYKLMKINLISSFLSTALSISSAFLGAGIWTFNIAIISRALLHTSLVFYYNKENRYRLSNYSTIKLFRKEIIFGGKIFIGRILNGIFSSIDKFLLAKSVGTDSLAQYKNSQQYAVMVDTHLRMPIGGVIYSYIERYSKVDQRITFFQFSIVTIVVTLMANGLLFLKGDEIYLFLFGENWEEASVFITYLSIFSTGLVLKGIYSTISLVEDRMNMQNLLTGISIILMCIDIFIYFYFDISLLNFVILLSLTIFLYWSLLLIIKLYPLDKRDMFLNFFLISLSILGFCEILNHLINLKGLSSFLLIAFIYEGLMAFLLYYIYKLYKKNSF